MGKKKRQQAEAAPPDLRNSISTVAADPTLPYADRALLIGQILTNAGYNPDGFEPFTAEDVEIYQREKHASYFLNSKSSVIQLELVELTHPAFTKTYRLVRNAVKGITVTLETGGSAFFEYYPMKISPKTARDDLDSGIGITFGDLGEVLPKELDSVMKFPGGTDIKPTVKYRIYRSDDLSAPIYGPLVMTVDTLSFDRQGCTFEAKAQSINLTRTGDIYSLSRFPALRGFL